MTGRFKAIFWYSPLTHNTEKHKARAQPIKFYIKYNKKIKYPKTSAWVLCRLMILFCSARCASMPGTSGAGWLFWVEVHTYRTKGKVQKSKFKISYSKLWINFLWIRIRSKTFTLPIMTPITIFESLKTKIKRGGCFMGCNGCNAVHINNLNLRKIFSRQHIHVYYFHCHYWSKSN